MTARLSHTDAGVQKSVERYLLGELTGEARERFEDHLFDCAECTAELKDGLSFLEAARAELEASPVTFPVQAEVTGNKPSWFAWLWQPALLAPALAACLAVIAYQSAVLLPEMRSEIAQSEQPTLIQPLVLANAGARGDAVPEILAPRMGSYVLVVDVPPSPGTSMYRCTLYSDSGAALWHVDVPAAQTKDAISIQVPAHAAQEGVQELRITPVTSATPSNDKLVPLASYKYRLTFAK